MSSELSSQALWYCVRTQTKREHIAAEHLRKIDGIDPFCPRIRYRKATRRGKVWWTESLFPGYILAKFKLSESERIVTYCQGVRGLVKFGSEIPSIPEASIACLRAQIAKLSSDQSETLTVTPSLEIGDDIEVANGPLQGMSGRVHSINAATERVKVLIEFLGETQPVDLDLFTILLPRKSLPAF